MMIKRDSEYNVAFITTHGALNVEHVCKFQLVSRVVRYARGQLVTTTLQPELAILT